MSSQSEVGHSKNVANLEDLISYIISYGAAYNPSANNIKLSALQTLLTNAKTAISNTTSTFTNYKNATNAREIGFDNIRKLSTRVVNLLDAGGAAEQTVKDAKTIDRKMRGAKVKKFKAGPEGSDTPTIPNTPGGTLPPLGGVGGGLPVPEDRSISTSQQSYDSLLQHLSGMIQLVSTEPTYAPNEADLKVTALNTYLTSLQTKNTTVINATTAWSNARIARNNLLYNPTTGLVKISVEVKKYVKALFGATSPQYKQLTALRFSTRNA